MKKGFTFIVTVVPKLRMKEKYKMRDEYFERKQYEKLVMETEL
jgi:hypothetical protein